MTSVDIFLSPKMQINDEASALLQTIKETQSNDRKLRKESEQKIDIFTRNPNSYLLLANLLYSNQTDLVAMILKTKLIRGDVFDFDLASMLVECIKTIPSKHVVILLASLAIVSIDWVNPILDLSTKLDSDVFSDFLLYLAEEFNSHRYLIPRNVLDDRANLVLRQNSSLVLQFLESKSNLKSIDCLVVWLRSGHINLINLSKSPFFSFIFYNIKSPQLFDVCVDAIIEIIALSIKPTLIAPNMDLIYDILNRLAPLFDLIKSKDVLQDDDKMRWLTRVFVEACESYLRFIVASFDSFKRIFN